MDFKTLIIVPAFNESGNIQRTVKGLLVLDLKSDVLVIDDGSRDGTRQEALDAGAQVVSLPFNLGIGGAVQTGFLYAFEHNYDMAVQVDGDGQHDPTYIRALLRPLLAGEADMSIGSRFMADNAGFKSSFSRRLGISFFVHLINALTGVKVTDPTSGFRAYNKKMIALFAAYYPLDFPEPEAIVVAQQQRARICEVPVVMQARERGSSSIKRLKSVYYMVKVTLAILVHMIRQRRTP
jgi:glycosyltransferase involved in cell wall biosynthesis